MASEETWRAAFLGRLELRRGDVRIERFRSVKIAALLGALARQPGRQFSRDELLATFWPDDDVEAARNSLRVALSHLRSLLGEGVLETTRIHVRLIPGALVTDVGSFEAAARAQLWREARSIYSGPYLPGLYDDATVAERERLEALSDRVREKAERLPDVSPSVRPTLPGYLTRFLLREPERDRLATLLRERRLITILGPGGIGKTRLATELAGALSPEYSLVAFVALEECFDASQLLERVRRALPLAGIDRSARELLTSFLLDRPTLLVLDNLEQLIESGAAEAIEELLYALPLLQCVVTSRRQLGIEGEQLFPLEPLSVEKSLELFLERARAVRPDFAIASENRASALALCRRLDGIPLAIELAASRIGSLTVGEIAEQLETSLRVLARPRKVARQASVHGAIAWSWRLLAPHLQAFLARLSIFRGGWTLSAATVVCEREDARECLDALCEASLGVREEDSAGEARYRLLELIRAFAAEQLPDYLRAETSARHRNYFAKDGTDNDAENIQAALESAAADGDAACAYALFLAYGQGILMSLGVSAALAAGRMVLAMPAPTPRERLVALSLVVQLADTAGDSGLARSLSEEALTAASDDPNLRSIALSIQGQLAVAYYMPPAEAIPPLREALLLSTETDDAPTRATVLRRLGILLLRSKELAEAAECFTLSEKLFASVGDSSGARYALANLAHVLGAQGNLSGSLDLYQDCLSRARAEGDRLHQTKLLLNIGSLQAELARWADALATGRECLRLCHETGNSRTLAFAFWNLPEPLVRLGEQERAAVLMHFAEKFWLDRFEALTEDDVIYRAQILEATGATLESRERGRSLSLADALSLALTP